MERKKRKKKKKCVVPEFKTRDGRHGSRKGRRRKQKQILVAELPAQGSRDDQGGFRPETQGEGRGRGWRWPVKGRDTQGAKSIFSIFVLVSTNGPSAGSVWGSA